MSFSLRQLTLFTTTLGLGAAFIACSASDPSGTDGQGNPTGGPGGPKTGGDIDLGNGSGGTTGGGDIDVTADPNFGLPATPDCGDGVLNDDEACDDGNKDADDGCYANCRGIYPGYICPEAGQACFEFAVCGDGTSKFPEQCDDGNQVAGDGCSDNCKIEIGFKCPTDAQPCVETICGDDVVEGAEMCEPNAGPGCTAQCQFAPSCPESGGACTSTCGDGLVLGNEQEPGRCDDGNTLNGDGCDSTCNVEEGYECTTKSTSGKCEKSPNTGECILRIPVVYRDFPDAHEAFGTSCSNTSPQGEVKKGLAADALTNGKPTPTGSKDCSSTMGEWYVDGPGSTTLNSTLVLYQKEDGSFVNRWGSKGETFGWTVGYSNQLMRQCTKDKPCGPYDGTPFFYPVDSIQNPADQKREPAAIYDGTEGVYGGKGQGTFTEKDLTGIDAQHNYGFTSEVTYWFAFNADTNAKFDFVGDDDVWVFVNGKLALDLGGKHTAAGESFTLSGASPSFGMEPGNVYEIKVFHAERQPNGSTFKLTLSGFDTSRSDCRSICGDGIVGFGEQCDGGKDATGGYNQCNDKCQLGSFCGDGVVDEGEQCDDADPAAIDCYGCRVIRIL